MLVKICTPIDRYGTYSIISALYLLYLCFILTFCFKFSNYDSHSVISCVTWLKLKLVVGELNIEIESPQLYVH